MNNIGIISGGGKLPVAIGRNLTKKNFKVVYFVIEEFYNKKIYENFKVEIIKLNSAKKILQQLKLNEINHILLAGNITRPSLADLSFDYQTLKLAKKLLLDNTGDNNLLESIKNFFTDHGFHYLDWKSYCPELFSDVDNLTIKKPSKIAKKNLEKALSIFISYGKLDIGQSLIMQNQIVLGLEAAEGTDNLIIRCKNLKKNGDKGILIKLSKYNQSSLLDIPTIGEQTINFLNDYNYEGIYLEKNNCIILDKKKTIDLANKHKLFISTCNKIE